MGLFSSKNQKTTPSFKKIPLVPEEPQFTLQFRENKGHLWPNRGILIERYRVGVICNNSGIERRLFSEKMWDLVKSELELKFYDKRWWETVKTMHDYQFKNFPDMIGIVHELDGKQNTNGSLEANENKNENENQTQNKAILKVIQNNGKKTYKIKWTFREGDLKLFPSLKNFFISKIKCLLDDTFPDSYEITVHDNFRNYLYENASLDLQNSVNVLPEFRYIFC